MSASQPLGEIASRCGYRVCQICDELRCSQQYFRRVFLRDEGMPPKRWLQTERLAVARRELGRGRNLAEVAELLGFASAGSLRREVRRDAACSNCGAAGDPLEAGPGACQLRSGD
jgi:AraC-like DNA-binding protein